MALDLNGTNQYVDMGSPAGLDDLAPKTVMVWLNLDGYGGGGFGRIQDKTQNIFFTANTAPANSASLAFIQNFSVASGFWCSPTNSLPTGSWKHVAIVYDNSSSANIPIFYIDGVAQALTTITSPSGTRTSDAGANEFIGNWSTDNTRCLDGRMEDVRIYNRILSAAEILTIYSARGRDNILNNLVMRLLCCDKGEGQAAAAGDPKDISENKFTSTQANTPTYQASHLSTRKRV